MKSLIKKLLYTTNIVLYFSIVGMWVSIPEELTLNLSTTIFNLCFSVFLIINDRLKFSEIYNSSRFRGFASTLVSSFLIFSILGIVNYLIFKHPVQLDISSEKVNSLTEQSISIISNVDKKIKFKVFDRKRTAQGILKILDMYKFENNNVEIELVDIELKPEVVSQYNITKPGTIVIEYRGKKEQVYEYTELEITNGIIKITREKNPVIYFTTGHGELDLENKSRIGLTSLRQGLIKGSFALKKINMASLSSFPDDLDALVILGPKTSFHKNELNLLDKYLLKGGSLFIALDPNFNHDIQEGLRKILSRRGIYVFNNLVVDKNSFIDGSNGTVPLVQKLDRKNIISKGVDGSVFFPLVSSIKFEDKKNTKKYLIAKSSPFPFSWGENNAGSELLSNKVEFSDGIDEEGPVVMFAAWENTQTKIVISGNSSFIQNNYSKFTSNFELFKNSVSWLVNENRLINFNLSLGKNEPVFISNNQLGVIFYFSVIFAPLALFIIAFVIYRKRIK